MYGFRAISLKIVPRRKITRIKLLMALLLTRLRDGFFARKEYKRNVKKCLCVTNRDYTQATQRKKSGCKLREMVEATYRSTG